MANYPIPYYNPQDFEEAADPSLCKKLYLNAWNVQGIIHELVVKQLVENDPKEEGFPIYYDPVVYDNNGLVDKVKSGIFIDLGLNYDQKVVQKRPAVLVHRGDLSYTQQTMNQLVSSDPANSIKRKLTLANMGVDIAVIFTELGTTEMLAEFIRQPFLHYQEQIQNDFRFDLFRLRGVTPPQIIKESKDHWVISLQFMTSFYDNWIVTGQDLPIKTISKSIFTSLSEKPLTNQ